MKKILLTLLDAIMFLAYTMSFCILGCLAIVSILSHYKLAIPSIIVFIVSLRYKNKILK